MAGGFHTAPPPVKKDWPAKLAGCVVEKRHTVLPVFASRAKTWPRISNSPPDKLMTTSSRPPASTNCGAELMDTLSRKSATVLCHTTLPVSALKATTESSSRPTNTLPSPKATPSLLRPHQRQNCASSVSVLKPSNFHNICPLAAFKAHTLS